MALAQTVNAVNGQSSYFIALTDLNPFTAYKIAVSVQRPLAGEGPTSCIGKNFMSW